MSSTTELEVPAVPESVPNAPATESATDVSDVTKVSNKLPFDYAGLSSAINWKLSAGIALFICCIIEFGVGGATYATLSNLKVGAW